MKYLHIARLLFLFLVVFTTTNATFTQDVEFQKVNQYFTSRKPFHIKRHLPNQPYFLNANERIQSSTPVHSREVMSNRGSLASERDEKFFAYDGRMRFNTVNLDVHPDVLDVGCSAERVYLRMKRMDNEFEKQIREGSLLVSGMDDFDCEIGQESDEPVLYRLVLKFYVKENERNEKIMVIDTKRMEFNEIFTNIRLKAYQPSVKQEDEQQVNGVEQQQNSKAAERWRAGRTFDLVNFNYDKETKRARNPSIENEEGNFKYVCSDCYFYSSVRFTIDIGFRLIVPKRAGISVYFENHMNTNLTMTASYEKSKYFNILKKKKITSIKFTLVVIPVFINVNFAFDAQFDIKAQVKFQMATSFSREGEIGFNYDGRRFNWIKNFKGQDLKYSFKLNEASLELKLTLIPILGIDFYGLMNLDFKFKPFVRVEGKYLNPSDDGCRMSYGSYWGMDGSFHIGKLKFKRWTIFHGHDKDWTFINERQIKALSGCWIKDPTQPSPPNVDDNGEEENSNQATTRSIMGTRVVSTNSTYYKTVVPCCENPHAFNISSNSTLVQVEFQVSPTAIDYGQYLVLNLSYTQVAVVQYGVVVTYPVEKMVYIQFSDLVSNNVSSIFVRFTKDSNETLYIDYFMERSINDIGLSIKMRRGFMEIQEPIIRPDFLSFSISQTGIGNGRIFYLNSSQISEGSLINVIDLQYPLKLSFSGEGTISIYPIYSYSSGSEFRMLVDRPVKFAIKYAKSLIPGMKLSHVHIYSNNEEIEENSQLDVGVRMLTSDSSFDSTLFNQLDTVQEKYSFDESVNSLVEYFYFDLSGTFDPMYLNLELVEIYDISTFNNGQSSFTLKYNTNSAFVALLNFTQLISQSNSNGISIKTDGLTDLFIDQSVPTNFQKENSMWMTQSETADLFGFSEYSNDELMDLGLIYLRVEPRDSLESTTGQSTRNMQQSTSQLSISNLKNENITVKVSFRNNVNGIASETTFLADLMKGNTSLVITIEDEQYTFDNTQIQSTDKLIDFLSSLSLNSPSTSKRWTDTVIPVIAYSMNVEGIDLSLESPQTLVLGIPKIPPFESMDETLTLGELDTGIFMPTPGMVKGKGQLRLINNVLSNGYVGTITASVVGFVLVVTLVVAIVALIVIKGRNQQLNKSKLDTELQ